MLLKMILRIKGQLCVFSKQRPKEIIEKNSHLRR